jgi:biotin synthase|tara:strand:+ start:703 stop:1710 length:1008 start_codon:yes stop_codon:yes gene_type:complete
MDSQDLIENHKTLHFTKPKKKPSKGMEKWSKKEIKSLFELPFNDLVYQAQNVHRIHFDPNAVQLSTLLSIKTGGCSEDCGYCPQSARFNTEVENEPLMEIKEVIKAAKLAKEAGASRFCMGAAWRGPKERDLKSVKEMISSVKELGLETCATLGMLKEGQAEQLKDAGLDYYNHNLDTSPEFYGDIISTRTYQNRLDTLERVREADINVCCGGIVGLGESIEDRVSLISQLANMETPPESVPINLLTQVEGTPLNNIEKLDHFDFIRTISVARITMPKSFVRLSAGRESMDDGIQALAFFAGANSIFYGEELLTTGNPDIKKDQLLFKRLNIKTI